jgi:hypothetical protein
MASYQVLYWYDIPVQVRARDGNQRASRSLPDRFQIAIDQAAMEVDLTGSDTYTDLFRWSESADRPGSAEEVVEAVAAELIAKFPMIDWRKTADAISHGK